MIPIYYYKKDAISIIFIVVLMQDIHKHYILRKADRVSPMSISWSKVKGKIVVIEEMEEEIWI